MTRNMITWSIRYEIFTHHGEYRPVSRRTCNCGFRIPAVTVVDMVADLINTAEILAAYRDLESEDIRGALSFAAETVRESELPVLMSS